MHALCKKCHIYAWPGVLTVGNLNTRINTDPDVTHWQALSHTPRWTHDFGAAPLGIIIYFPHTGRPHSVYDVIFIACFSKASDHWN
jgi:hypothetical protein